MDMEKTIDKLLYTLFTEIAPIIKKRSDPPFFIKGGCSLNRGLNIISRRSHDIDLTYTFKLLGVEPIKVQNFSSRTKIEKEVERLDQRCIEFNREFIGYINNSKLNCKIDKDNPLNIIVCFPDKKEIVLETGGRSLLYPPKRVLVPSTPPFEMYICPPEQSMMERIFGIHSDIHRGVFHRHHVKFLYDIVMINRYKSSLKYNRELLFRIAEFNYIYYRWNREVCNSLFHNRIKLIPTASNVISSYKDQWDSMAREFFNNRLPCSFNRLLNELREIEREINT